MYISRKWKTRGNVGPLLNEVGVLVKEGAEKAELLNAFFASVFSAKASPMESQALPSLCYLAASQYGGHGNAAGRLCASSCDEPSVSLAHRGELSSSSDRMR